MRSLTACWKLLRAIGHALGGWWTIRFVFPTLTPDERNLRVQHWAARMLELMGVRLVVEGTVPSHGPLLLVCNHLSWLDIVTIHAARHVRFVSKAGVHRWPHRRSAAPPAAPATRTRSRPAAGSHGRAAGRGRRWSCLRGRPQ